MYNPVNMIDAFKDNGPLVPYNLNIDQGTLEETASASINRLHRSTSASKPKLDFTAKTRPTKNQTRRKPATLAVDYGWASMVSHNSGAAAAKRRIARVRHRKERLVSNLFQSDDTQRTLSELSKAKQLDLLNRLLLDVRKMQSTF